MPPLIAALPAIAAIASIGAAGTTIGLDIANAGGGGAPKPAAAVPPPGPTSADQAAQQKQTQAAVAQQTPTIEGLTSGYANPGYYAQQGAVQAGVAGQPNADNSALRAVEQAFGLTPGSLAGGSAGGASSAAKPFTPAGVGDPKQGAFPTGTTDLSDFVNTFFKG